MKLLGTGNPKTSKGEERGFLTFIMHLAPHTLSGYNVCPMASIGCALACLNTSGRGAMNKIQEARIKKTKWFFEDRDSFMIQLARDIQAGIRKAVRENLTPVFRLNGTSDIRWENMDILEYRNIMEMFPDQTFYDYTKLPNRKDIPSNYNLTFSRSESNENKIGEAMCNGMNVAVVFDTKKDEDLPNEWRNLPVVDGDADDLRFLDAPGVFVGLRAKGKGKKDSSGFVVEV